MFRLARHRERTPADLWQLRTGVPHLVAPHTSTGCDHAMFPDFA
jgi:hypothetical protein